MAETTTPKKRGRKAAAAGQPVTQEVVVMVPLAELHPFPDHPFQVRDDESMRETAASVKENGVIIPGLVRPREEGGYEIIAGHRRKHACELAGLTAMPVIVRDMDRDSATVVMVDSNLQRESILPSERAKAYKMKLDAIKRRAGRPSKDEQENAPNVSANFRSDDEVGQDAGVSGDTIRNYIALTQLVPELQKMVDDKKIALTPAYQLAALTPKEQALLLETIDSEQATPSLSQAQRMKKLSQSGELNEDTMLQIMAEQKKPERTDITLPGEKLRKYFPAPIPPCRSKQLFSSCWTHGSASASVSRAGNRIPIPIGQAFACPIFLCPEGGLHVWVLILPSLAGTTFSPWSDSWTIPAT